MDQERSAKISRRAALQQLSILACAVPIALMSMTSLLEAQHKASKAEAAYQDNPMGDLKCAGCAYFLPPKGCEGVDGDISPSGWCKLYKSKA